VIDKGESFQGTATEMLNWLNLHADESTKKQKGWPGKPQVLSAALRRAAPNLRRAGVSITFDRTESSRTITVKKSEGHTASGASGASAETGDCDATPSPVAPCVDDTGSDAGTGQASGERQEASIERQETSIERQQDLFMTLADDGLTIPDAGPGGECHENKSSEHSDLRSLPDAPDAPDAVCPSSFSEVSLDEDRYRLVTDPAGLQTVLSALEEIDVVGLDTETTALSPKAGRLRLLSLAVQTISGETFTYVLDADQVDLTPLFPSLAEKLIVAHNARFDLSFLMVAGFVPGRVADTMILSQLLYAGQRSLKHGLADCAERELGRSLDKTEQKGDWSGTLTQAQIAYAARDAEVLLDLYNRLRSQVEAAGMTEVARIESECLPAIAWLAAQGVAVDRDAWAALADTAEGEAHDLCRRLDAAAPEQTGTLAGMGAWNWNSPEQVKEALRLLGCPVEKTDEDTLAALDHPFAQLLRGYRSASKRGNGYGRSWLEKVAADGRVYASWRQIGSDAGRMSCSGPNLQQIPRDKAYRRCFRAPTGRVLLKADYSQIELRIAAKVAGERVMLAVYQRGDDLHTLTARQLLGKDEVTKEDRQLAKAVNFGLLHGMGARGFKVYARTQFGVDLTDEQASQYRDAFFRAYPDLANWHRRVRSRKEAETRTLAGRRRLMDATTPDTHRLNSPVQGTGADGLKQALALLWKRRGQCPGAFPVLVVHDEIVVECDEGQADAVSAWLKQAMLDGMAPLIAPVPVEVEVKVGRTWAGDCRLAAASPQSGGS
jgi:DNA polymerase-1